MNRSARIRSVVHESPFPPETIPHYPTDHRGSQTDPTEPHNPRRRIDYIFYRPSARWRVIESRALDEAVASDHRPVLSVMELRP
jgi:endonuclease/exonuclease/phosphatase (EEP) superfamily protein YafD